MENKNVKFLLFTLPFIVFGGIVIVLAVFFSFSDRENTEAIKPGNSQNDLRERPRFLQVNRSVIKVEYAISSEEKSLGLSGRTSLDPNSGMLFLFSQYENHRPSFWMKEMLFPLDIIWIKNGSIVDISKNVPNPPPKTPLLELPRYAPKTDIDSVLEVNAGWTTLHEVKIGDKLEEIYPVN